MKITYSVFHVEHSDHIAVQRGDFISLAVELVSACTSVESVVWVAGKAGVSSVTLHKVSQSVLGGLLLSALTPCSSLDRSDSIFAYFAARVGRCVTSTMVKSHQ